MNCTARPLQIQYEDGYLSVRLQGEIDHHTARAFREELDHQLYLYHPRAFTLSLSGVDFMDSSGLGLILGRFAICRQFSCPMRLCGAGPRLLRIFHMAGLERMTGLEIDGLPGKDKVTK